MGIPGSFISVVNLSTAFVKKNKLLLNAENYERAEGQHALLFISAQIHDFCSRY